MTDEILVNPTLLALVLDKDKMRKTLMLIPMSAEELVMGIFLI